MFVVQVEGNIGIGKSTFINFVKEKVKHCKNINIKFIDESILEWMNVENNNLLDLYYTNPPKYGQIFQCYIFLTTLRKCLKENYKNVDIIFMERSLYTSIHCFNKLLLDEKIVDLMSHNVLKNSLQSFNDIILQPDLVVYFSVDNKDIPLLLQNRILPRKRQGESNISIDYLVKLNNIYNDVIKTYYSKRTRIIKYKYNNENLLISNNNNNSQIFSDIYKEIIKEKNNNNVNHQFKSATKGTVSDETWTLQ